MNTICMAVDWNINRTDLENCFGKNTGVKIYKDWVKKIKNSNISGTKTILEDSETSCGGLTSPDLFMFSLKLLSDSIFEKRQSNAFCIQTTFMPMNDNDEPIDESPAVNTRMYNDPLCPDYPVGLCTENLWLIGEKGIVCFDERKMAFRANPLKDFYRALESVTDSAREVFTTMAGEVEESSKPSFS